MWPRLIPRCKSARETVLDQRLQRQRISMELIHKGRSTITANAIGTGECDDDWRANRLYRFEAPNQKAGRIKIAETPEDCLPQPGQE